MTRKLTALATVAVFATAIGCSKSDETDKAPDKAPAGAADKAPAPAADTTPTAPAAETKTDAKLLALKFHHDD